jgi:hypothetical protein
MNKKHPRTAAGKLLWANAFGFAAKFPLHPSRCRLKLAPQRYQSHPKSGIRGYERETITHVIQEKNF